jgi:ribonuclease P protein component
MRNTFGKAERLTGKTTIERLVKAGRAFRQFPFRVVWSVSAEMQQAPIRVAFAIPKRNFKRAVKRNLIRRHLREAWRTQKHELYAQLNAKNAQLELLIIYTHNEVLTSEEIKAKILLTLQRLIRVIHELPSQTDASQFPQP